VEKDLDRIIGEYAEGSISDEERAWLEEQMQADPELRAFVEEVRREFLVEDYVNGKLSGEEKEEFEARLEEDQALRVAVERFRKTRRLLELDRHSGESAQLEEIVNPDDRPEKNGKGNGNYWLVLLFLGVVVAGALYFLIPGHKNDPPLQETELTPADPATAPIPPGEVLAETDTAEESGSPSPESPAGLSSPEEPDDIPGETEQTPQTPPSAPEQSPAEPELNLDSLRRQLGPIPQAGYMDQIRRRDEQDLRIAGPDWQPLIVNGDYDEARQILEDFFQENGQNYTAAPPRAYYLGALYLYTPPVRAADAAQILESLLPNMQRYRRKMPGPAENIRTDLLRAYLLSNTPEHREKARALLQENPELIDQL